MRSASGSKASRVCMGLLPDRAESRPRNGDCLFHARWRCAAGDIVDREHVLQTHKLVEVFCKMRIELLQLRQLKIVEFAPFIECQPDGLSDDFVRNAEWHTLAHKISRRRKCVHV